MGLPLIATPILASVFGPKEAVVIITIPIFVANTILVLQSCASSAISEPLCR